MAALRAGSSTRAGRADGGAATVATARCTTALVRLDDVPTALAGVAAGESGRGVGADLAMGASFDPGPAGSGATAATAAAAMATGWAATLTVATPGCQTRTPISPSIAI
jgi:hypothetical protein